MVTVSDRDSSLPTVTLPKLRLAGFDPSAPGVTLPVPVRGMVRVGLEALEVMVTVPVALPAAVGVNLTVKGTLFPAAIVTGSDNPLTVKSELFVVAAVTVTLASDAIKLPDAVPLLPTATLPRFSVVGFTLSCPG